MFTLKCKFKDAGLVAALIGVLCVSGRGDQGQNPPPPDWARNLVIYEIATKGFTSPHGPESGTFRSLKERVPYLADLGINAIWLTGWNLANNHFFGIWSQYATIDPSRLDPSLGTAQDFKELIAELHKHGIKVFLDSTEHGVVDESPLIKEHPAWFTKGTWGMTDYDWRDKNGPHPDLDQWWIGYWVRWITEFGIDGARLDVAVGKPALWAEIKRRAAAAGHPIVVFCEGGGRDPVSDFHQPNSPALDLAKIDMGKMFGDTDQGDVIKSVLLSSHDYSGYVARGSRFHFGYLLFAPANFLFMSGEEFDAAFKPLPRLTPDLYGEKAPGPHSLWLYGAWMQWDQLGEKKHADMLGDVKRLIGIRREYGDLVRACGHGVVANIADVDSKLADADKDRSATTFSRPYVMWNEHHALLVGGHTDANRSFSFLWDVPVDRFGWKSGSYKVTDLWGNRGVKVMDAAALAKMDVTIGPDRTTDGGLAVFEIEPAN